MDGNLDVLKINLATPATARLYAGQLNEDARALVKRRQTLSVAKELDADRASDGVECVPADDDYVGFACEY